MRVLASVVGRDGLTPLDLKYLEFADQFENVADPAIRPPHAGGKHGGGWEVLRRLPKNELTRLSDAQIARYIEPAATQGKGGAHA